MQVIKETAAHTVYKKRSGKYAVKTKDGKFINGAEKVKILNIEGLVKGGMPKAKTAVAAESKEPAGTTEKAPS